MRMDIDEAGREHSSGSFGDLPGGVMRKLPDRADQVGIDGDVRHLGLAAAAVDDAHVSDKSVTERHGAFSCRCIPENECLRSFFVKKSCT